ncbi:glycosyltransferase family 4 protein [Streptomyces sp. URMC 129]|uniref:glycosyltransferase family 4 protein n=1 Tax=Streptomyces sp. URMC 129 TaxID=3423407 RepID=UPI003F1D4653
MINSPPIVAINTTPRRWAAGVGVFLTHHVVREYGLATDRVVRWPSGLHLDSSDLAPMPAHEAERVVRAFGIPTDRPIVAAVGRTDPTKGLDLLIEALAPLRDEIHLAAIAVRTDDERAALLDTYRARCDALGLRATWTGEFTRALPRALASLPATRVMAVPSRGETLANLVFETALWARDDGAVVLAPAREGFPEQITDEHNGLLYDPDRVGALTDGLRRALALSRTRRRELRAAAHRRVLTERDAVGHLATLLAHFWPTATGPGR